MPTLLSNVVLSTESCCLKLGVITILQDYMAICNIWLTAVITGGTRCYAKMLYARGKENCKR